MLLCGMMILSAFAWLRGAEALAVQLDEEKVKAGLVYNVLKYTHWPANSAVVRDKHLQVCLYGRDAFHGALDPMQGRTAQQFRISIVTIDDVSEIIGCNLLYIARSQESRIAEVLEAARQADILTVSDIRNFSQKGGMIELTMQDRRVRLYVNEPEIGKTRLKLHDRLLRLSEGEKS